ncbi:lycopene cyclase domain-containing protein [Halorussus limi]|uniref:Lycopene cyclase domain-containing protein n=1 Tax=Halorussus limi TaxID=2938695 RepID=A0A8U0HQ87_9EURY|nr:lycopene cyclase domain-containing protein [Halorussus limi]UPV72854.1 lycopene cyclase domain-containing protein [Halorussus limi]
MSTLTYVEFLLAFLGVPVAALAVAVARKTDDHRRVLAGVAALVCIAVTYTAPWDSYLVGRGVWTYGEGVVAARFARVPLGEWLFFVLQTVTTGLWYHLLAPRVDPGVPGRDAPGRSDARTVGAVAWLALAAVGAVLTATATRTYYLGMILVWAGPVVAFLWAVGGPVVWRYRRLVAAAVAVPSAYLWAADRFAIGTGLWTISPDYSTGLHVAGLPVEEAIFFALTNLLVVQGLLLFDWVTARAAERGTAHAVAGLVPPSVASLAGSLSARVPGVAEVRRRWQ